jgi:outer membrane murein-binding lipoprotein Lpp
MKAVIALLTIIVIFTLSLVCCGVSQDDYDTLLAEKNSLQSDYDSLAAEKNGLTADLAAAQAKAQQLESDLSRAQTGAEKLQTDIDDLSAYKADLEIQLEAANAEVKAADLRHFTDAAELEAWRESVGIIDAGTTYLDSLLELQRIAFEDGYILSIDLDYSDEGWILSLNAFTGDAVYLVYSDETGVYYLADL